MQAGVGIGRDIAEGWRRALPAAVKIWYALTSAYVLMRYLLAVRSGGHVWITGDWLLNWRAGYMRRGLTGSLAYSLSDLTGIDPLYIVSVIQVAIFLALAFAILHMLNRVEIGIPVALLILSPAFLMPFFIVKQAMSKEMIGFLALAFLALRAFGHGRWTLRAAVATFAFGSFAHEINAFLAPHAAVLLAVLVLAGAITRREAWVTGATIAAVALVAIVTAMIWTGAGLGPAVCQVMLDYGGRPEFCGTDGPTIWLDRDLAYGMAFTWDVNVVSGVWPWFILGFGLSMLPFSLFQVRGNPRLTRSWLPFICASLAIVALAPLFFIASDWGRWISMHVTALTLIALAALKSGLIEPSPRATSPLWLLYGAVWAMPDFGEPLTTGLLQKFLSLLSHLHRFAG